MAKKRIYEVAKELGIENKIVVKKAQDLGFDVKFLTRKNFNSFYFLFSKKKCKFIFSILTNIATDKNQLYLIFIQS